MSGGNNSGGNKRINRSREKSDVGSKQINRSKEKSGVKGRNLDAWRKER